MKKTILIVDDEKDIVEILTECVQHMGHEVLSASNGEEGLQQAMQGRPDLVISDINMPKMTGLQLLEKLKEQDFDAPVILFTAFSDTQKIKQAWKLGAFDFIEKPIDLNALKQLIDKALEFGSDFKSNPMNSKLLNSTSLKSIELKLPQDLYDSLLKQSEAEGISVEKQILRKLQS